jgi:hypothetical protein
MDNSKTKHLALICRDLNPKSHSLSLLQLISKNTTELRKAELYRRRIIFPNGNGNCGGGKMTKSDNFTFHTFSSF